MNVSIVIATYNEGPDLRATVAQAMACKPRAYEVIVTDDHSVTDVEAELSSWPEVKLVRPPSKCGSGANKGYGLSQATGDIAILLDAHMRFSPSLIEETVAAVKRAPGGIFCFHCTGFRRRSWFGGANFVPNKLWPHPLNREKSDELCMVPCLYGGAYVLPRHLELDWNSEYFGWGCEEQDLSLRAWQSGHSVWCIPFTVEHNFEREGDVIPGNRMAQWHLFNVLLVCATVFEDGVFERYFQPFLLHLVNGDVLNKWEEQKAKIQAWRKRVQEKRIYTDGELESLCGYKIPTLEDQRRQLERQVRRGKPS